MLFVVTFGNRTCYTVNCAHILVLPFEWLSLCYMRIGVVVKVGVSHPSMLSMLCSFESFFSE